MGIFEKVKAFWHKITGRNKDKKNTDSSLTIETRTEFQQFVDGREGVGTIFILENDQISEVWGVEVHGFIFYIKFYHGDLGEQCLVWMIDDTKSGFLQSFANMSQVRFDKLGEEKYCPTLVRFIKDCINDRYDRGAMVNLLGHVSYVISMPFYYTRFVEKKDFSGLLEEICSGTVMDSARRLLTQINTMHQEIERFDGLSTWDDIKVTIREKLPGARMGWQIGNVLSSILGL